MTQTTIDNLCNTAKQRYDSSILAKGMPPATHEWHLRRFEHGWGLADEIESRFGTLVGTRILDLGASFGGDIAAMHARGAYAIGADLLDHDYSTLQQTLDPDRMGLNFLRFDCTAPWPLATASFDVVISLGVLEFVQQRDLFFAELTRVLKLEGIAILRTPLALPGIWHDAHYQLPLVSLLPPRLRRWVAERLFHRPCRFKLSTHNYFSSRAIERYARRHGLDATPTKYATSSIMARAKQWPLANAWQRLIRTVAADYILLTRSHKQHPQSRPTAGRTVALPSIHGAVPNTSAARRLDFTDNKGASPTGMQRLTAARIGVTPNDLQRVSRVKRADPQRSGWSVRMQHDFGYFSPEDHYEALVAKLIQPGTRWLDVGCGRHIFPSNPALARTLAQRCALLVGVDPSDAIDDNPYVHRKVKQPIEDYQADGPFDVITLRMVAEHIEDPRTTVASLARLTRPGSQVIVYTVNKWSPVTMVTQLTPFASHHRLKSLIWEGSAPEDTFPVQCRMNTRRRLAGLFRAAGFQERHFAKVDDCRTFAGFRRMHFVELSCRTLLRRCGLTYPEYCLLAAYERC